MNFATKLLDIARQAFYNNPGTSSGKVCFSNHDNRAVIMNLFRNMFHRNYYIYLQYPLMMLRGTWFLYDFDRKCFQIKL